MTVKACDTCAWFVTGDFIGEEGYGICVLSAHVTPYVASHISIFPDDAAERIRCKTSWCRCWECEKEYER